MICRYCGSSDGYWDCEYWECTDCGESSCATNYGIDVYNNGCKNIEDYEEDEEY